MIASDIFAADDFHTPFSLPLFHALISLRRHIDILPLIFAIL